MHSLLYYELTYLKELSPFLTACSESDLNCSFRKISSKMLCTFCVTSNAGLGTFSISSKLLTLSLALIDTGFPSWEMCSTLNEKSSFIMFEISISCNDRSFSTLSLLETMCSDMILLSEACSCSCAGIVLSGKKGEEYDNELSLLWDVDALSEVFLFLPRFFFLYAANCKNNLFLERNVMLHYKKLMRFIFIKTYLLTACLYLLGPLFFHH